MDNLNRGFIVLWRKIEDNPIFKDSIALHLFIHLLLEANHKPARFVFNDKEETLVRGQMITGRKKIVEKTGIKESTVYKKLKLLEKLGFCNIKSNNKFSVITISNYSLYQDLEIGKEEYLEQPDNIYVTTKEQLRNNYVTQTTIQPCNNDNHLIPIGTEDLKKPKKEVIKKQVTSPVSILQEFYYSEYENQFGVPYPPNWGKDGAIFKDLLKTLDQDNIKNLILTFFKIKDSFVTNSGYSVGVFRSQIAKLQTSKEAQVIRVERMMTNA